MKRAGFLIVATAFALSACTSIPKQNLDSYIASFNIAKASAQDLYLAAQVQAEKLNDGTNTGQVKLAERVRAVKARLTALEVIGHYNGALVKLATGTDPAGVKEDLEGISSGLKSLQISQVTSLVANVAPFLGVVSQVVALIDNAIKAERFGEAVAAAQRPIQEIIGILIQDAGDLREIQVQVLERQRDPDRDKLLALYYKLQPFANSLLGSDGDVNAAIGGFNAALARWQQDPAKKPDPLQHAPASGARTPSPDDRALLQTILNQGNALVDSYNQTSVKIKAHLALIEEYKNVLDGCGKSFVDLNTAIRESRRAETIAFATNVMNLRKAYIDVKEAK